MATISRDEYNRLKGLYAKHEAWVGERRSYRTEEEPEDCRISNDERALIETYEWLNFRPREYFLYVNTRTLQATGFMGNVLGTVTLGREWRDNFGGRRVPIRLYATNGLNYHGTYYKSSGSYARVKASKVQP